MAPLIVPTSPIGYAQRSLLQERDQKFESTSLQLGVCCEPDFRCAGCDRQQHRYATAASILEKQANAAGIDAEYGRVAY